MPADRLEFTERACPSTGPGAGGAGGVGEAGTAGATGTGAAGGTGVAGGEQPARLAITIKAVIIKNESGFFTTTS